MLQVEKVAAKKPFLYKKKMTVSDTKQGRGNGNQKQPTSHSPSSPFSCYHTARNPLFFLSGSMRRSRSATFKVPPPFGVK